MAAALRNSIRLSQLIHTKHVCVGTKSSNKRFIMTSRARVQKALEDVQKNPYFNKYAEKIAKLQKTSPEEFLRRVGNEETKLREKKGT